MKEEWASRSEGEVGVFDGRFHGAFVVTLVMFTLVILVSWCNGRREDCIGVVTIAFSFRSFPIVCTVDSTSVKKT